MENIKYSFVETEDTVNLMNINQGDTLVQAFPKSFKDGASLFW